MFRFVTQGGFLPRGNQVQSLPADFDRLKLLLRNRTKAYPDHPQLEHTRWQGIPLLISAVARTHEAPLKMG